MTDATLAVLATLSESQRPLLRLLLCRSNSTDISSSASDSGTGVSMAMEGWLLTSSSSGFRCESSSTSKPNTCGTLGANTHHKFPLNNQQPQSTTQPPLPSIPKTKKRNITINPH
jgi:hypothetical protein